MGHNDAMKKFLSKTKQTTGVQRADECEWCLIIIKWNSRDWEIIISKDKQKIEDHVIQFDDPANFAEKKPFDGGDETKMKGIKLRPRINKLYAGKIKGPQRKTLIATFKIPEKNARRLKITNLDKE